MVSPIIVKINARDKVLDFRDGLVPAMVEDYAMLHGCGGKGHASNSVIKLYICDYTAGTGDKSKTVSACISPELCEQLFEVCKNNLGNHVIPDDFAFFEEQRAINRKLHSMANMCYHALDGITKVLERYTDVASESKAPSTELVAAGLLKLLKKAKTCAEKPTAGAPRAAAMPLPRHMDYNYTQDRVHAFNSTSGIAPVQRLQIWHTAYRKEGDLGKYPWTIKVTNGKAKVRVLSTGATTFDPSTMKETEEAYIQASDSDMFRALCRVIHYINVWEAVFASKNVAKGRAQWDVERKKYLAAEEESA